MSVTIFSLIMAILWFDAFILFNSSIRRKTGVLLQYSLFPLIILIIISLIRVIIPLELPFATVLRSCQVLPFLQSILEYKFSALQISVAWALVLVCATVSVILLIHLIVSIHNSKLSMQALYKEEDERAKLMLQEIIDQTKPGQACTIRIAPGIGSPIVTGFVHPLILMPEETHILSDKQLKYILHHEWSHYLSKDLWAKLLIHILCCIMWWNPPVHLLKKDLDQILELKCDQRVISRMKERERLEYLETILEILRQYQGKETSFLKEAVGVNFIGVNKAANTTQRFQMVYDYKKSIANGKTNLLVTLIMAGLFIVSYSFVFQPYTEPSEHAPGGNFTITRENAYLETSENGGYKLYVNGGYFGSISADERQLDPYKLLLITED